MYKLESSYPFMHYKPKLRRSKSLLPRSLANKRERDRCWRPLNNYSIGQEARSLFNIADPPFHHLSWWCCFFANNPRLSVGGENDLGNNNVRQLSDKLFSTQTVETRITSYENLMIRYILSLSQMLAFVVISNFKWIISLVNDVMCSPFPSGSSKQTLYD